MPSGRGRERKLALKDNHSWGDECSRAWRVLRPQVAGIVPMSVVQQAHITMNIVLQARISHCSGRSRVAK